jgi:hypothetical protein
MHLDAPRSQGAGIVVLACNRRQNREQRHGGGRE